MAAFLKFYNERINEIFVPTPIGVFPKVAIHSSCGFIAENKGLPSYRSKASIFLNITLTN